MRKKLKWASLIALAGVLTIGAGVSLRTPSLERDWDDDVRVLAGVELSDDGAVTLTDIRDWRYTREAVVSRSSFDATFDPADIVDLWMYEQILDGRGWIAHTFLVFEFDQSYGTARYLGLSVETRREAGETYSLLGGVLREFEVTHIWATETDLVTRRVEHLDYPLTRYRLEVPHGYRERIFTKFARETRDLAAGPRWYNTVANNCTSSLIRYVNEAEPDVIPLHYSYVLTGKVDAYLEELGFLDSSSALPITREYLATNALR